MKKRILSLALAVVLTIALVPAAFAAGTTETVEGVVEITNVLRVITEEYEDWSETIYVIEEGATMTVKGDVTEAFVSPFSNIQIDPDTFSVDLVFDKQEFALKANEKTTLKANMCYEIYAVIVGGNEVDLCTILFYVVDKATAANFTGGSTPAPSTPAPSTPAPTPATPAPVPVTPATTTPATGSTAALKTTNGLISVIPPTPVKDKDLAYTVQKGETLWGIAFNYYGSMGKATVDKIYTANAAYFQKTKGILEAGAVITLPAKGMLVAPVTQGSLDKCAGMYLVKAGDTLADIAKTYYGDSKQWKKLYEANKDRVKMVGSSPMIYEKQWLVIPE